MRTTPLDVALLVLPCCLLLALADMAIAIVPLRRLARWLGAPLGPRAFVAIGSSRQTRRAVRNARAIGIAARLVPFRADCYPQALVAVALGAVFRVPTATHFGARLRPGGAIDRRMDGHVWVASGRATVVGDAASFFRFPTLACFVRYNGLPTRPIARHGP